VIAEIARFGYLDVDRSAAEAIRLFISDTVA
jgi:hypothetical protein